MSAQVTPASGADKSAMPTSATALEKAIQDRRDHLAATIDELTTRAKPKEIARRGVAGVQRRLLSLTHTPEGQLRTERLGAVAGAVTIVGGVLIFLRRRK